MIFYSYDKETGEYLGQEQGQLDPLETEKQGHDVYLKPAYTTEKKPPVVKENKKAVFNGLDWVQYRDFRGKTLYNPVTGEQQECKTLGTPPRGFYPVKGDILTEYYTVKMEGGFVVFEPREKTTEEKNADIRAERRVRMINEADPLYYDFVEALAKGKDAEGLKTAWLNKKDQIRNELPYINE